MSLKAFHILIIFVSIVACCAYGMWGVITFMREGSVLSLLSGSALLAGGLALLMHGVIFYKHAEEDPWL